MSYFKPKIEANVAKLMKKDVDQILQSPSYIMNKRNYKEISFSTFSEMVLLWWRFNEKYPVNPKVSKEKLFWSEKFVELDITPNCKFVLCCHIFLHYLQIGEKEVALEYGQKMVNLKFVN